MSISTKGNHMTSGSKSKAVRKDKNAELRADLTKQLEAAKTAQAEKLQQSKEFLSAQLKVAEEKYLTVNGYMQARSTYDQVLFGKDVPSDGACMVACRLAHTISGLAAGLAAALESIDVMDLDESFFDGLLATDFIAKDISEISDEYVCEQLLVVNLLQNISPSIDDIVQFREGSSAGIASLEDSLAELLDESPTLTAVE